MTFLNVQNMRFMVRYVLRMDVHAVMMTHDGTIHDHTGYFNCHRLFGIHAKKCLSFFLSSCLLVQGSAKDLDHVNMSTLFTCLIRE